MLMSLIAIVAMAAVSSLGNAILNDLLVGDRRGQCLTPRSECSPPDLWRRR